MAPALIPYGLLAFAAGTMLNLMPCVLPVMPFKIQAILRSTGRSRTSRLRAAGAIWAGSQLFFIVLGAISASVGLMWGQLFQYAGVRLMLGVFFLAAAAATFTGWSVRLPRAIQRLPMAGDLNAFFIGALAGILSTPCAGPFLGSVLAYSATRPATETLVIFSAIGSGLTMPMMVLVVWPGLIRKLSFSGRPGAVLKTAMGFALLAAGLFFAQDVLPDPYRPIVWLALAAGAGIAAILKFTRGRTARLRPVFILALAMLVITGFMEVDWHAGDTGLAWQPFTPGSLSVAADRPVMVYFGADWCINCRAMDRTTFRDGELLAMVERMQVTALKVDLTRRDETKLGLLDRYGGYAIPFVVLLDGADTVVRRFTGVVAPRPLMETLTAIAEN